MFRVEALEHSPQDATLKFADRKLVVETVELFLKFEIGAISEKFKVGVPRCDLLSSELVKRE